MGGKLIETNESILEARVYALTAEVERLKAEKATILADTFREAGEEYCEMFCSGEGCDADGTSEDCKDGFMTWLRDAERGE